jgi:hypothetical protein
VNFKCKKIEESDYENILTKWWSDWGFEAPPQDFLSDYGLIVYDGDTPVCAGYIYLTNSSSAIINWVVSNKDYRKKPHRDNALDELIINLTYLCEKGGYKYIFIQNNNNSLISRFKKHGFITGVTNSTELIKNILWH